MEEKPNDLNGQEPNFMNNETPNNMVTPAPEETSMPVTNVEPDPNAEVPAMTVEQAMAVESVPLGTQEPNSNINSVETSNVSTPTPSTEETISTPIEEMTTPVEEPMDTNKVPSTNETPFVNPLENLVTNEVTPTPTVETPVDTPVETIPQPTPVNTEAPLTGEMPTPMNVEQPMTMEEPTSVPEANGSDNDFTDVKPKKKPILIVVIILAIVALAAVGFFVWKTFFDSPKNTFLNAVNNSYKDFTNFVEQINNNKIVSLMSKNTTVVDGTLKIKMDLDASIDPNTATILNEFNKLSFTYHYGLDLVNKRQEMAIGTIYQNSPLLNIFYYLKDQKAFLLLENIFDKYISTSIQNYDEIFEIAKNPTEDAVHTVQLIKNSFLDALQEEDFVQSEKEISVNNESIKTTMISYEISQDNASQVAKKIYDDILKDEKAVSFLAQLSNKTIEEMKKEIEALIKDLETPSDEKTNDKLTVSTYTAGNNNVRLTITTSGMDEYGELATEEIEYTHYQDYIELIIRENSMSMMSLINQKIDHVTYKTTLNLMGVIIANFTEKKESETASNYTYSLTVTEPETRIEGTFNIDQSEITKDKAYKNKGLLTINLTSEGQKIGSITIDATADIKFGETLQEVDTTNAIDSGSLTEADFNKIMTNLSANPTIAAFINAIAGALTPYNPNPNI